MPQPIPVVGLGGSLRAASTSRTALQAALDGVAATGAAARLLWVRDLDLPLYTAEGSVPRTAYQFADTAYDCEAMICEAMIWSSPTCHGSVSGSFKNALDWLILLAERDPPYLANKPVGLVATAGGVQGLQRSTRWSSSSARPAAGAFPWFSRWRSHGSPSAPTAASPMRASLRSCARSARRSSARHASSRRTVCATTRTRDSSGTTVAPGGPRPAPHRESAGLDASRLQRSPGNTSAFPGKD